MTKTEWDAPPETPDLIESQVHLWRLQLDLGAEQVRDLSRLLSPDERTRASRYRIAQLQEKYIACHGQLRILLGRYLASDPRSILLIYSAFGKPSLAKESNDRNLRFNMSHSDNLAVIAVGRGRELGVDIERIDPVSAEESVAQRFFAPEEVRELEALRPEVRVEAFFRCWTRKEAYIKARGKGLTCPLDQFVVSLKSGEPARLLSVKSRQDECVRWSLASFIPANGYVGAVAIEGQRPSFRYYYEPG